VGVEKEKVNAENAAAQVEAESCAVIQREVTELQARCEGELAAAEPLVQQAMEALDTLTKKDLGGWGGGGGRAGGLPGMRNGPDCKLSA
jgi:dynein heavy chain